MDELNGKTRNITEGNFLLLSFEMAMQRPQTAPAISLCRGLGFGSPGWWIGQEWMM